MTVGDAEYLLEIPRQFHDGNAPAFIISYHPVLFAVLRIINIC